MADSYLDERIRSAINQAEEQERINSQSIYEGITVKDRYYKFQEMAFFEEKLKIYIPTAFFDMPDEQARRKYPSSDRPKIIKTEDTGRINITLNLIPNNVCEDQIVEVKDRLKNMLKRLNPSYLFLEEGVETVGNKTISFFEFKSPAIDTTLFNLMFITTIDRNLLMGTFNCVYEEQRQWKMIAHQIMKSIKTDSKMPEQALSE